MSVSHSSSSKESFASNSGINQIREASNLDKDWRFYFSASLPIIAVCFLSVLAIEEAILNFVHENDLGVKAEIGNEFGQLIHHLQRERSMSCQFLANNADRHGNLQLFASLTTVRRAVDRIADGVDWLHTVDVDNKSSMEWYDETVVLARRSVDGKSVACIAIQQSYVVLTDYFMKAMMQAFDSAYGSEFWSTVDAYSVFVLAQNAIGMQRAIGTKYLATGILTSDERIFFLENRGKSEMFLDAAFEKFSPGMKLLNELRVAEENKHIFGYIQEVFEIVENVNLTTDGPNSAMYFFNRISEYLDLLIVVEMAIEDHLMEVVAENSNFALIKVLYNTVIALIVLVVSVPLTCWYAWRSNALMGQINVITAQLRQREQTLTDEQKKTDQLLFQLIPKTIADSLKAGDSVNPEMFESITLFFCEVVGFEVLAANSNPLQVCKFLNHLYERMDGIIAAYDVYKVETIGASYMVVSGLPKKNGDKHAMEIGTMALDILMEVGQLEIPHLPGQTVIIRAGAHSGSCAAGVIGVKMPRYCLFGDTINTTARLETTSSAGFIHISAAMKQLLDHSNTKFYTEERGTIAAKGKGNMVTHWLLGRDGFPYSIDKEKVEQLVESITYWRKPSLVESD